MTMGMRPSYRSHRSSLLYTPQEFKIVKVLSLDYSGPYLPLAPNTVNMASASNQVGSSQGQDEKTKEVSDVEVAYQDQGYHEMEFTTGMESDLHRRKQQCDKNPGHVGFIPAGEFTIEHLPEAWRDSLVFDFITTLINLTVKLAVRYTSKDRPPNFPLHNRIGQHGVTAYGSGLLRSGEKRSTEKNGGTCPCKACKQSPHLAKTQWWEFWVHTAKHVVFDDSEAKHTRCDLFCDSDAKKYNCPSLEGSETLTSGPQDDCCSVKCVTHNEELSSKLEEMIDRHWKLLHELRDKNYAPEQVDSKGTAVIVSHPHGLCKYVTIGQGVTIRQDESHAMKWIYTAETCKGSSGGYVFLLTYSDGSTTHFGPWGTEHSGCEKKTENESVTWRW